jgi:predicted GIY-YIG superfamily endonuclease
MSVWDEVGESPLSWVYVFRLAGGKWYVGFTRDPERRIYEHYDGRGAEWTKLHPPERVVAIRPGDEVTEQQVTLQMMKRYGWQHVRGSIWCQIGLAGPPPSLADKRRPRCYRIRPPQHPDDR